MKVHLTQCHKTGVADFGPALQVQKTKTKTLKVALRCTQQMLGTDYTGSSIWSHHIGNTAKQQEPSFKLCSLTNCQDGANTEKCHSAKLYCTYNLTYSVSFQPRGKLCELCSRQPCELVETTSWWLDDNANLAPCSSQYFKSANPSIDGRAPDVRCRSLFISADFTGLAHQTIQPMIAFIQSPFSSKGVRICVAFVQTWLQHDR